MLLIFSDIWETMVTYWYDPDEVFMTTTKTNEQCLGSFWYSPAEVFFMTELKEQRLSQIMKNTQLLQSFQYDWKGICSLQKSFQKQLDEKNTSISEMVAEACLNLRTDTKGNGQTKVV